MQWLIPGHEPRQRCAAYYRVSHPPPNDSSLFSSLLSRRHAETNDERTYRKTYRPWEPQRYRQEAHSPEAKLPESDLVFVLLDTVSKLDVSRFYAL